MPNKAAELRRTVDCVIAAGPFQPTLRSLENYHCPDWYKNGKFGIFIHWGVYAVPAFGNEWYPREMYVPGTNIFRHHRETYGDQSAFGYKDFVPMFQAAKFDPAAWAELLRESGAKFVVPVAEHHDGFAMYGSELNRWNAVEMGPRRDLIGDLAAALREAGLTLGLSSHRAEHYWFFGRGMTFPSDVQDPAYADLYGMGGEMPHPGMATGVDNHTYNANMPSAAVQEDWLLHTCEFVEKYRPSLVWFDWWINNAGYAEVLKKFIAYYYNRCAEWGIEGAVNYKYQALPPDCAVFDVERGQLDGIYPLFWQTDTAVAKNSWGYTENQAYKSSDSLIADLCDIVSKNGALLLNIGPRADGVIPDDDARILREIGAWLGVNGEAIYDTRPYFVFGEGPTAVASGAFSDTNRAAYTASDIRYTRGDEAVYAIGMARNAGGEFRSHVLARGRNTAPVAIARVELLGHGELPFVWDADSLRVKLPDGAASATPFVLKLVSK